VTVQIVQKTPAQRKKRLEELTGIVKKGLKAFEEMGDALFEIRENDLYLPDYATFPDYCEGELGWSKRNADRYIRAAQTAKALRPHGLDIENEAQGRAMSRLEHDPEAAKEVWREVGAARGGARPYEALREAVARRLGPDPDWPNPDRVVELPEDVEKDEGREVFGYYGGEKRKYPKDISPKHTRAAGNTARRVMEKRLKEEARANRPTVVGTGSPSVVVHLCEIADLSGRVGERSVDLVLTDPPYGEKNLPLFSELGLFAKRVLKPTGLLVSYMGNYHTPHAINRVIEHVPWYWQMIVLHAEKPAAHDTGFSLDYKPIEVFGTPSETFGDTQRPSRIGGKGGDKEHHEWGQPVDEAVHLIETLTEPGDMVVDPFLGGGTTAVAAKRLGRSCIAGEKDYATYQDALERVRAEPRPPVVTSGPPREGEEPAPPPLSSLDDMGRYVRVMEAFDSPQVPEARSFIVLRPQDIP